MTEPNISFPVGVPVTEAQVAAVAETQMQERAILDPQFAGFELQFDWHDYIDVDIANRHRREEVERALHQFARTPEGQQLIRQAAAMQAYRYENRILAEAAEEFFATHPILPRVRIVDGTGLPIAGNMPTASNNYFEQTGNLSVDFGGIRSIEFLGADGRYYDLSLQRTLFHELCHAADPLSMTPSPLRAITSSLEARIEALTPQPPSFEELWENPGLQTPPISPEAAQEIDRLSERIRSFAEYPAIAATNVFMRRYFGEAERALNHDSGRRELPLLDLITTQRDLGADHFYDAALIPSPTPPMLQHRTGNGQGMQPY